jgi:hypothetical protein
MVIRHIRERGRPTGSPLRGADIMNILKIWVAGSLPALDAQSQARLLNKTAINHSAPYALFFYFSAYSTFNGLANIHLPFTKKLHQRPFSSIG